MLKKSEMLNAGTITRKQNKIKKMYEKFNKQKEERMKQPPKTIVRKKNIANP
jgi:hypothetical protein